MLQKFAKVKLGGGQKRIDKLHESGKLTARERIDLLLDKEVLGRMNILRLFINDMNNDEAMNELLKRMRGTKDNEEFLASMNR